MHLTQSSETHGVQSASPLLLMAHAFGPLYTVIRYKTDRGGNLIGAVQVCPSLCMEHVLRTEEAVLYVRSTPMPAKGPSDGATVECQLSI